ncbi:hypothetical protein V2J09_021640 [Rumex salicifolius]
MEIRVSKRIAWLIWATNLWGFSQAIWLTLPNSASKCVSEEIHSNVVVLADFYVVAADDLKESNISVKVTSPYGNTLYHAQNQTIGQFAFTSHEAGNYLACFWAENKNHTGDFTINLDWKTGIAAKDWASVAKKEKIDGVELELKKLEGTVQAIHENLLFLKHQEREMRSLSEKTNTRVALCSLFSLTALLSSSSMANHMGGLDMNLNQRSKSSLSKRKTNNGDEDTTSSNLMGPRNQDSKVKYEGL